MAKIKIVFHPGLEHVKHFRGDIPDPKKPFDLSVDVEGETIREALSNFFKSHHPLAPLLCDEKGELSEISKRRWPIAPYLMKGEGPNADRLFLCVKNEVGVNVIDLPLQDGWEIFVDWRPGHN